MVIHLIELLWKESEPVSAELAAFVLQGVVTEHPVLREAVKNLAVRILRVLKARAKRECPDKFLLGALKSEGVPCRMSDRTTVEAYLNSSTDLNYASARFELSFHVCYFYFYFIYMVYMLLAICTTQLRKVGLSGPPRSKITSLLLLAQSRTAYRITITHLQKRLSVLLTALHQACSGRG